MAIENRLKEILKEKKVTQTQLANYIGVTAQAINNIVKNKSEPSLSMAMDISDFLEIPVGDIFYKNNHKAYIDSLEVFQTVEKVIMWEKEGIINHETGQKVIQGFCNRYKELYGEETFEKYKDKYIIKRKSMDSKE